MVEKIEKWLLIGLDGATFDLLTPLMQKGIMPNLAALQKKGMWGRLQSTVPPFTAAAWSTLITGQNPGGHGVISFSTRDRFNYDLKGSGFTNANRFDHTIWELMSDFGKKVAVINVPLTFPPRKVNGVMVTGMLTPPGAPFTFPEDLGERLRKSDYMVDVEFIRKSDEFRLYGLPAKREMLSEIHKMLWARTEACLQLMMEELYDFFMVVFTGTDRIAHFFWDDLETIFQGERTEIQNKLVDYFVDLDLALAKLIEQAGLETAVLIMSDHGFGGAPSKRLYLNIWLEKLGLIQRRRHDGLFDLEYLRTQIGRHEKLKRLLRKIIPQRTQDAVTTASGAHSKSIFNWQHTKAYFVPIYFHVCGIEINLKGRHREGVVSHGLDYERLREQIITEARSLTDTQTGQKIVQTAAKREEIYQGKFVETFPDIILVLDPDYVGAASMAGSLLVEPHPDPFRPGEHREDGVFMAFGPNIRTQQEELTNLSIADIPATILYGLGIPIPTLFDGRVIEDIFAPSFLKAMPKKFQQVSENKSNREKAEGVYTAENEEQIADRLRRLGYLD